MSGSISSPVIDFCIGMFFFFFVMTMVCTMINEYFMDKVGKLRQKNLLEGISGLFYDAQKVLDLYKHPLITALYRDEEAKIAEKKLADKKPDGKPYSPGNDTLDDCVGPLKTILGKLPSYIPSRTFAAALLDILPKQEKQGEQDKISQPVDTLRQAVIDCGNDRIKGALLPLIDAAGNDVEKARRNIEKWFDDTMDRVGGWFKRNAKQWLLGVGFVVCVVLNADTIMVGKILWQDPERLAVVVTAAQKQVDQRKGAPDEKNLDLDNLREEINKKTSQFPIGWVGWKKAEAGKKDPRQAPVEINCNTDSVLPDINWRGGRNDGWGWDKIVLKLLGLIFTALAISLGAPFWTDLLNSFVNLRRGGKKPAPTAEEGK
jgi:hypothetical protein